MLVISDTEAIRYILQDTEGAARDRHPRYVCYLGAGASAEAGVKTAWQICSAIHDELLKAQPFSNSKKQGQIKKWENTILNWNEPTLRYVSCIKAAYPSLPTRIEYFRKMLRGVAPSFCHQAVALLSTHRYFRNTCLTTNFDKLLENAFTQQGTVECQAIRTEEEIKYRARTEDRHYIIKLHGDYDTNNILNTDDETVSINEAIQNVVYTTLEDVGLVVIGTAGYEKSIHTMFDNLSNKALKEGKVLRYGLLWGIYMGPSKPQNLTKAKLESLVQDQINKGEISRDIKRMIERANSINPLFCFFPVWGAGNFMLDLIKDTENKSLIGAAELYLDRKMRLRHLFRKANLSEEAINKHISSLDRKRTLPLISEDNRSLPECVYTASSNRTRIEIRLIYGDITSRTFMGGKEFQEVGRAIISPEDTFISAGGGVAEALLKKAGPEYILNETAKFAPIEQGTIAVTSAGKLPAHYIFHAAAIKITPNASYIVTKQSVYSSIMDALQKASALKIGALWVPLMGTGVATLNPKQALESILEAIRDWKDHKKKGMIIMIFIHKDSVLSRFVAYRSMKRILGSRFQITA